jgi:amino acid transporter
MDEVPFTEADRDGDAEARRAASGTLSKKAKLGVLTVAAFTWSSTSAGPFGIEESVASAGPLPTLLFILLCPLFVMLPIIVIMGELVAMMPSNHGTLRWVARGLGPTVGFVNSLFQLSMNTIDLATYPVIASDYIEKGFFPASQQGASDALTVPKYALRVAIIVVFGVLCLLPMKDIGAMSIVFSVLVMSPFVVGFFAGVPHIDTTTWSKINDSSEMSLSTLLSTSFWMYVGFLANSQIAGECEEGALFTGQLIALALDALFYLLPLSVVLHLDTYYAGPGTRWTDGYLVKLFDQVLPGLGYAVSAAGFVSSVALYVSSVTTYSRALWSCADFGWLPRIFRSENRYRVPWVGVCLLMFTSCVLNLFDFKFLLRVEFVFASVTYILFVLSFVSLRYNEPDVFRPFRVPGGGMSWLLWCLPLTFLTTSLLGSDFTDWSLVVVFVCFLIVCAGLHWYLSRHRTAEQHEKLMALLHGDHERGDVEHGEVEHDEKAQELLQQQEQQEHPQPEVRGAAVAPAAAFMDDVSAALSRQPKTAAGTGIGDE